MTSKKPSGFTLFMKSVRSKYEVIDHATLWTETRQRWDSFSSNERNKWDTFATKYGQDKEYYRDIGRYRRNRDYTQPNYDEDDYLVSRTINQTNNVPINPSNNVPINPSNNVPINPSNNISNNILNNKKAITSTSLIMKTTLNVVKETDIINECTLCLENIEVGTIDRITVCKHHFHPTCIDKWFLSNSSCPNCRLQF